MWLPGEGTIQTRFRGLLLIGAVVVSDARFSIGEILWWELDATIMFLVDRRKHKKVFRGNQRAGCVRLYLRCVIDFSTVVSVMAVARCLHIYNYIYNLMG
jgi:hypothetical protein